MIPTTSFSSCQEEKVIIDGIGRISHPLELPARSKILGSFKAEEKDRIMAAVRSGIPNTTPDDSSSVVLLEENSAVGLQVEQWAVEYTSKFVVAAGPRFLPTTAAIILGLEYVKSNLPEVSPCFSLPFPSH